MLANAQLRAKPAAAVTAVTVFTEATMPPDTSKNSHPPRFINIEADAAKHVGMPVIRSFLTALFAVALAGCESAAEQGHTQAEPRPFDSIVASAGCMSCHLPGNGVGAPAWRQVAEKYKSWNTGEAETQLENRIAHGGSGVWGRVNMPPFPELPLPELTILARGILASDSIESNTPRRKPMESK